MRISYKNKSIISLLAIGGALLLPFSVHLAPATNTQSTTITHHTDTASSRHSKEIASLRHSEAAAEESISPHTTLTNTQPHLSISRNIAQATGEVAGTNTTNVELAVAMEGFLKVVYILLWPLLWLAGQAMDNSMIYGEFIGIDSALFKFRGIMKNFANFALGFMFLRSVISYVINPSEKKHPKDMIIKLLLAGLGIQVSWFAVGAMVDLSSLLTHGIGALPLQFMSQSTKNDSYVFGIKTTLKLNDAIGKNDTTPIAYTLPGSAGTQPAYLLPCFFTGGKIVWDQATRGAAFGVNGTPGGNNLAWSTDVNPAYCIRANKPISKSAYEKTCGTNNTNCPLYIGGDIKSQEILSGSMEDFKKAYCDNSAPCQTMKTIAENSKGYQSAFYALYSSLLNLSTIHIGVPKTDASIVMETLIKTLIGLAYLIPLAVLCVVLIMRIGYLWLVIAFSPFIALASVKDLIPGLKGGDAIKINKDGTPFSLKNVISLLLLPVVVTFAISLSIVFLSSLSNGLTEESTAQSIGIYSRQEGNYKCYDVAVTDICIDMPSKDIGSGIFDYFGWLIMNIFGIGLMWFVVMAALKSSKFTEAVATKVGGLASNALMNAPIVPVGGKGNRTSLGGIQGLGKQISTDVAQAGTKNTQVLSEYLTSAESKILNKGKAGEKTFTEATTSLQGKTNSPEAAHSALTGLSTPIASLNQKNSMSFGDYGAPATDFVNALAVSAGMPAGTKFTNGGELFSTDAGKELLAKIAPGESNTFMESIRHLYSGQSDGAVGKEWEEIKADVDAIQKAKYAGSRREHRIASDAASLIKRNTVKGTDETLYKKGEDLSLYDGTQLKAIASGFNAIPVTEQTATTIPLREAFAAKPEIKASDGKTYTISISDNQNDGRKISVVEKAGTTTKPASNAQPAGNTGKTSSKPTGT